MSSSDSELFRKYFRSGYIPELLKLFEKKLKKRKENPKLLSEDLPLEHGPLAKNQDTIDLENLFKYILHGGKIVISTDEKGDRHVRISDEGQIKDYNISEMLKHVNFSHISVEAVDMKAYVEYLKNNPRVKPTKGANLGVFPDEAYFRERDKAKNLENLNYAELLSLNIYTTDYYKKMNAFMRRKLIPSEATEFQDALINVIMANSGLNKIPTKQITTAVVRAEEPHDLERRIQEAEKSGGVTIEEGFISTSIPERSLFNSKGIAKSFQKHRVNILYQDVMGKDISAVSQYPTEREFLMPPTQISWKRHHSDHDRHFFLARPVVTPQGLSERALQMGKQIESMDLNLLTKKTETILKTVINIKNDYNQIPRKWYKLNKNHEREQQMLDLIKKANELLDDKTMSPSKKLEEISLTLHTLHNTIEHEKRRCFGLFSSKSHLSSLIENVQVIMPSYQKFIENTKNKDTEQTPLSSKEAHRDKSEKSGPEN